MNPNSPNCETEVTCEMADVQALEANRDAIAGLMIGEEK